MQTNYTISYFLFFISSIFLPLYFVVLLFFQFRLLINILLQNIVIECLNRYIDSFLTDILVPNLEYIEYILALPLHKILITRNIHG